MPLDFNRAVCGRLWTAADLPARWKGREILLAGDLDADQALDGREIELVDWPGFRAAVAEYQRLNGLGVDGDLGDQTLAVLRRDYHLTSRGIGRLIARIGGIDFRPSKQPTAPPARLIEQFSGPLQGRVAQLFDAYGEAILSRAKDHGLPLEAALAVLAVESGGNAYDPISGLVTIRVELPGRWPHGEAKFRATYGYGQAAELKAITAWAAKDPLAAYELTSWGLCQTLGKNHKSLGYPSPYDLAVAYQDNVCAQIAGFFAFIEANGLTGAVRSGDWETFARVYNGPGQVAHYAGAIREYLWAINQMKTRPWRN
ncbi:MAG: N-acetylmuramidase domain-containing protein [Thermodesulfobacteriota bacterium]